MKDISILPADSYTVINKTVIVRVEVEGETIYNEEVDKNVQNLKAGEAIGTGTVTVKVFIDGAKKAEQDIDLNQTNDHEILKEFLFEIILIYQKIYY